MATKIPKDGLRPSPVYEAHMSDGEVVRMSFYSPAGKPIDMDGGRRAVEACVLPDQIAPGNIYRAETAIEAYRCRRKVGGVYHESPKSGGRVYLLDETPWVRGADGAMRHPPAMRDVQVVRAFVEHPTIGRVEHVLGVVVPFKAKRKARGAVESVPTPLSDRARAFALILLEEFSRDRVDAPTVAQAIIGLREALQ